MIDDRKQMRGPVWKLLIGGVVILGAALGGFWAIAPFSASDKPRILPSGNYAPHFRISKETTAITEPLDEEGYPDFEAAVNARLGKGIDPKKNMVAGLFEALGPQPANRTIPDRFHSLLQMDSPPEKGEYVVAFDEFLKMDRSLNETQREEIREAQSSRTMSQPWKAAAYPQVAAWLKANGKALERVDRASRMPQYFFPLFDLWKGRNRENFPGRGTPNIYWFGGMSDLLLCRAWLKIGEGDDAGACEDFLICHRILSHFRPKDMVDFLAFIAWEWRIVYAERSFLEFTRLSNAQLIRWKEEIDSLPKKESIADFLNWSQRFENLQEVIRFNRFGKKYFDRYISEDLILHKIEKEIVAKIRAAERLDWNECLREINQGMDRVIAAHSLAHSWEREKALKLISEDWKGSLEAQASDLDLANDRDHAKLKGQLLALVLLSTNTGYNDRLEERISSNEEQKILFKIALALTLHRRDKGHYPEALDELVPAYLAAVPNDYFSGSPHHYKKTPEGYLLYSVGVNRVDDLGGDTLFGDPPGDDVCARVPKPR